MNVYFDNAATTPLHNEVIALMHQTAINMFGNPSSSHSFGRKSRAAIEQARKTIAKYLNASPLEIIFTSCGTESNNMVLKMSIQKHNIKHIVISEIEHKCVLNTAEEICNKQDVELHILKVNKLGHLKINDLSSLLERLEGKMLVSIMHANNEIGTIADIKKIASICKVNNALFHSDTVQTIAHYPFDVKDIEVDFISGSAHKFHGPKGVGFLYMKQNVKVDALIQGGGQERNLRSGTENLLSIIAMEKALQVSIENMQTWRTQIEDLKKYFKTQLTAEIDGISFNGDQENCLYTVLSVSFPERFHTDMFLFNLDIKGIAVSGGSACSSGANKGSHVISAIGIPENRQSIRFSFSHYNTKKEVDYVIEILKSLEKN